MFFSYTFVPLPFFFFWIYLCRKCIFYWMYCIHTLRIYGVLTKRSEIRSNAHICEKSWHYQNDFMAEIKASLDFKPHVYTSVCTTESDAKGIQEINLLRTRFTVCQYTYTQFTLMNKSSLKSTHSISTLVVSGEFLKVGCAIYFCKHNTH